MLRAAASSSAKTGQRLASFFGRLSFPDLPAIDRERRRDRWRDAARHLVAVTAAAVTTVSRFCHACARVQNLWGRILASHVRSRRCTASRRHLVREAKWRDGQNACVTVG